MRSILAAMTLMAIGIAATVLLAGTMAPLDIGWARHLLPERLDGQSLVLGIVVGLALAQVLRVPWLQLPRRGLAWVLNNGASFRWMSYGGAFLAVLLLY